MMGYILSSYNIFQDSLCYDGLDFSTATTATATNNPFFHDLDHCTIITRIPTTTTSTTSTTPTPSTTFAVLFIKPRSQLVSILYSVYSCVRETMMMRR